MKLFSTLNDLVKTGLTHNACVSFPPADELLLLPPAEQTPLQAPLSGLGLLARPRVAGGDGAVAGHAVEGPLPPSAEVPGAADARLGGVEREHGELRSRQRFWKMGREIGEEVSTTDCLLAIPLKCIAKCSHRPMIFPPPAGFCDFSKSAFKSPQSHSDSIFGI